MGVVTVDSESLYLFAVYVDYTVPYLDALEADLLNYRFVAESENKLIEVRYFSRPKVNLFEVCRKLLSALALSDCFAASCELIRNL